MDDKFEIVGSSAYRLMKSACFLKSGGAMTCLNCHNPHRAEQDFDAACRQCHATGFTSVVTAGRHTSAGNCAGCHMPKRRPADVVHTVFTDHLIQRRPPPGDLLAELPERHLAENQQYRGEVVPYLPKDLATRPEGPLYAALAQVQMGNNLVPGATQLADAIARMKPGGEEFYLALAGAWQKLGRTDDATAVYQQALRMKPDSTAAMLGLAGLWASTGGDRFPGAAGLLDRGLRLAPRDARLTYQRGLVSYGMGQLPDAVSWLRKALKLDADLPGEWTRLGEVLLASKEHARATDVFDPRDRPAACS